MNDSLVVNVGGVKIGGGNPIVVQTMCNTHTYDEEATIAQCRRLAEAGSQLIRITVPGPSDVEHIRNIHKALRAEGITTPLVADIHFSAETALLVAPIVEKVRINPGNFHRDHDKARELFGSLIDVCRENGTAIRIGVNHGSLGEYITNLYGNTPHAMAEAAMEWIRMCIGKDFYSVVVSLKSSNTVVMTQAYRELSAMMQEEGVVFPLHVGVTEAGNGDSGRMKSCVGCSALLSEGIGDTIRVSLTEDPQAELPVARYLSDRYGRRLYSSLVQVKVEERVAYARYEAPSRERLICDLSCDFGKMLLEGNIDDVKISGSYISDGQSVPLDGSPFAAYLEDELLQATRRRFYRPEYIACPGCGRTMYNLQKAFEDVKEATSGMKDVVIAVMGCIVNGPGEMADADWGYVGEGAGKVSIYHGKVPVRRHVPESEAVSLLVSLIQESQQQEG